MAVETFDTILKAQALAEHTFRVTSNCNRYPKKYRFSLVDKMQNRSLEIYECIMEANRTDLRYFKRERSELQTRAITYCDQLEFYIELSHKLGIINEKSMEYWSKMVADVKHMTIAWRTEDKKR